MVSMFITVKLLKCLGSVRSNLFSLRVGGGRVVRWCWSNFQYWGALSIWIIVGQGPTALAVYASGVVFDIFLSRQSFWHKFFSLSIYLSLSLSEIEIVSEGAVKPNDQPTKPLRVDLKCEKRQTEDI